MELIGSIVDFVLKKIPNLKAKLLKADIKESSKKFVKLTLLGSLIVSIVFTILLSFFLLNRKISLLYSFLAFPIFYLLSFMVIMRIPNLLTEKKRKILDKEALYAGRFLTMELESGSTLSNAFLDLSKSDTMSGKFFEHIGVGTSLGKPMEVALRDAVKDMPSEQFRKILAPIENSMRTGTDVVSALKSVMDDIENGYVIEIKDYGKKLGPLAMFYLVIGTVAPSIGAAFLIVAAAILDIQLSLTIYLVMAAFLVVIQMIFILFFRSVRPSVNL